MDSDDTLVPVPSTRIGEIGIGSFLILAGGVLFTLSCVIGPFIKDPQTRFNFHLASTGVYTTLILYLVNAPRRSKWVSDAEVVAELDYFYWIRIGTFVAVSFGVCLGALAIFQLDYCRQIVAKDIIIDNDKRRLGGRKFLF